MQSGDNFRRAALKCVLAALGFLAGVEFSLARSAPSRPSRGPSTATSHGSWTVLNDCVYTSNQSNDGDSFHVSAGGKPYLFRLYFVDAPETDVAFEDRVDEQAKYFGVTRDQVIQVGKLARTFTREKLAGTFTVRTCFQDALGRSRMERFYAIVQTASGDLGEQLIENGLARIHGASANPIGLPSANVEWQKLTQLEIGAKVEKVGGWGVNFGRMTARSEKSKNRAPIDPFEAFFHPERLSNSGNQAAPNSSPWPFPSPSRDTVVAINPSQPRDGRNTGIHPVRPAGLQSVASSSETASKLDINSATETELKALPGIGPVLAQRIISARPFKSADDLHKVKGIGDARYERLRPFFN